MAPLSATLGKISSFPSWDIENILASVLTHQSAPCCSCCCWLTRLTLSLCLLPKQTIAAHFNLQLDFCPLLAACRLLFAVIVLDFWSPSVVVVAATAAVAAFFAGNSVGSSGCSCSCCCQRQGDKRRQRQQQTANNKATKPPNNGHRTQPTMREVCVCVSVGVGVV